MEVRRIKKAIKAYALPIHFEHVPREENKLADWLTNVPRVLEQDVDCEEICPDIKLSSDPPWPATEAKQHVSRDSYHYLALPK